MRLILPMTIAAALLSACDQDFSQRVEVAVDGRQYAVSPMRNLPGAFYAEPANRSVAFAPYPGIRQDNLRAIEAVSGCAVIPESIRQVDHISTEAEVDCRPGWLGRVQ